MTRLLPLLLLPFILIASCVNDNEPRNEGVAVGDPLPQFAVALSDGSTVSTQSLRGKPAVVILFTTKCPDCRSLLPEMQKAYAETGYGAEAGFVAIAREETEESVARFWADNGMTIPYSPQSDRTVYSLFASSGVPRIYIADKNGIIIASWGDKDIPLWQEIVHFIEEYPFSTYF